MGSDEETSWLANVISAIDKLALSIGGYEEEPRELGFSDDESDMSTSEEEDPVDSGLEDTAESEKSGFKDAGESPGGRRVTLSLGDSTHKISEKECIHTKTIEHSRSTSSLDRDPSLPATTLSTQDHLDMEGLQGSKATRPVGSPRKFRREPGLEQITAVSSVGNPCSESTTPCQNRQDCDGNDLSSTCIAPPRQQGAIGSGFDSMFSTPAHSRERQTLKQDPPPAVIPDARSAGSRRGQRERPRSKEDPSTSTATSHTHTAEEPTLFNASPALGTSCPNKNDGRPAGGAVKKYSHVNDTAWLKPKENLLEDGEDALSQPEVPDNSSAGECSASQTSTTSTSIRRDQYLPSSQTNLQHRHDVDDDDVVAKTGSQAEGLSIEALHKRPRDFETKERHAETQVIEPCQLVEDTETNEAWLAQREALGSAYSDDRLFADVDKHHVDMNGRDEAQEGEGPTNVAWAHREEGKDGVEHLESSTDGEEHFNGETDETAMVGAKRTSVENGTSSENLGWIIDSPVGFAPSKRGKTQSEYPLAVMRHSARLDDAIHERQRKLRTRAAGSVSGKDLAKTGGSDGVVGVEERERDELESIPWPDRALRPYDTPIVDTDLPFQQAKKLSRLGMDSQTFIISSPFRRCLQTAGVVARTLGVANVTVHLEVGERMDKVRKEIQEMVFAKDGRSNARLRDREWPPAFSYLKEDDMREALGGGVQIEGIVGEQPPDEESGVQAKQRFIATIAKVRKEQLREGPVLVVAHGDTLDAAGESLASQIVFEADYCAWALFDLDVHQGRVKESYGIQMIPL